MTERVSFHDTWEALPGMDQTSYQVPPGLRARLRDLVDDDCMGPWRPEAREVDEVAPAPIWLENDAGDLLRVDVAAVAMVMSALPLLLAMVDAVERGHEHATPMAKLGCSICHALDELDAPA